MLKVGRQQRLWSRPAACLACTSVLVRLRCAGFPGTVPSWTLPLALFSPPQHRPARSRACWWWMASSRPRSAPPCAPWAPPTSSAARCRQVGLGREANQCPGCCSRCLGMPPAMLASPLPPHLNTLGKCRRRDPAANLLRDVCDGGAAGAPRLPPAGRQSDGAGRGARRGAGAALCQPGRLCMSLRAALHARARSPCWSPRLYAPALAPRQLACRLEGRRPLTLGEATQIVRYDPGQYYALHLDNRGCCFCMCCWGCRAAAAAAAAACCLLATPLLLLLCRRRCLLPLPPLNRCQHS